VCMQQGQGVCEEAHGEEGAGLVAAAWRNSLSSAGASRGLPSQLLVCVAYTLRMLSAQNNLQDSCTVRALGKQPYLDGPVVAACDCQAPVWADLC
jgi:hypothetical protein